MQTKPLKTETKSFYRIREVSAMLELPSSTLRFWESVFPMFQPQRTEFSQRRYTNEDVEMAKRIKHLLHEKGMTIEGATELISKTCRKYPPRKPIACRSCESAVKLLDEVSDVTEDAHALAKLDAVKKFISKSDKRQ